MDRFDVVSIGECIGTGQGCPLMAKYVAISHADGAMVWLCGSHVGKFEERRQHAPGAATDGLASRLVGEFEDSNGRVWKVAG